MVAGIVAGVLAVGAAIVGGIMSSNAADRAIEEQRRLAQEQKRSSADKARAESIADLYQLNDDPVGRVLLRNWGLEQTAPLIDSQADSRIDQIETQKALSWLPVASAAGNLAGAVTNYATSPNLTPTVGLTQQPLRQEQTPAARGSDPQAMIPVEGTTSLARYGLDESEDETDPYRSSRWRFVV